MYFEYTQDTNDLGEVVYQLFALVNGKRLLLHENTDKNLFDETVSEIIKELENIGQ